MSKNKITSLIILFLTFIFPLNAFASCKNSPETGLFIITEDNKKKLISTYQINFQSDDLITDDLIYRAIRMAENKATFRLVNGYNKLKKIESQSSIVSGLMKSGQCYEKGKFVKVTFEKALDLKD